MAWIFRINNSDLLKPVAKFRKLKNTFRHRSQKKKYYEITIINPELQTTKKIYEESRYYYDGKPVCFVCSLCFSNATSPCWLTVNMDSFKFSKIENVKVTLIF